MTLISGSNGSGKSAVLQALQACLGLSARGTGRGSQMGDFIRHGADFCLIQVRCAAGLGGGRDYRAGRR